MASILIDLDGVLYEGDRPINGAAETIAWLEHRRIPHLFLTNTTSRPRRVVVEKMMSMGLAVKAEQILTPPVVAQQWLIRQSRCTVALFVPEATREDFSSLELLPDNAESGADAVVIGDLGESWTFALLNRAFRLLESGTNTTLVALGMTRYWRAARGLQLDTGPFVKALEYATSRTANVIGKPSQTFFQMGLDMLGTVGANTLMIGDDIKSDVEAAQSAGLKAALVRTGKFKPADLERDSTPDTVLDSIACLEAWWGKHMV